MFCEVLQSMEHHFLLLQVRGSWLKISISAAIFLLSTIDALLSLRLTEQVSLYYVLLCIKKKKKS